MLPRQWSAPGWQRLSVKRPPRNHLCLSATGLDRRLRQPAPAGPACPEPHEPYPLACAHTVAQVYAVATCSSNGSRLPLDTFGAPKSVGEVGLLAIPGDGGIGWAQGHLRSLVLRNEDLRFDQASVEAVRSLAGHVPPPEPPAGFVTKSEDGYQLMLAPKSASGYSYVSEQVGGYFRVSPPTSFPSKVRRDLQTAGAYATALEAASDIARRLERERLSRAAAAAAQKA